MKTSFSHFGVWSLTSQNDLMHLSTKSTQLQLDVMGSQSGNCDLCHGANSFRKFGWTGKRAWDCRSWYTEERFEVWKIMRNMRHIGDICQFWEANFHALKSFYICGFSILLLSYCEKTTWKPVMQFILSF